MAKAVKIGIADDLKGNYLFLKLKCDEWEPVERETKHNIVAVMSNKDEEWTFEQSYFMSNPRFYKDCDWDLAQIYVFTKRFKSAKAARDFNHLSFRNLLLEEPDEFDSESE